MRLRLLLGLLAWTSSADALSASVGSLQPTVVPATPVLATSSKALKPTPAAARFAFLAGWTDVMTFTRHNMYVNMLTGNTINLAMSLASLRWLDFGFFSAIVLSYAGFFAVLRNLIAAQKAGSAQRFAVWTAAPAVLLLFVLTDLALARTGGSRWAMALLAGGCGLVNSACAETTGTITSMVTGHIQGIARVLADAQRGAADAASRRVARQSLFVVASFAAGVAGGTAFATGGVAARLMPAAVSLPAFSSLGVAYACILVLQDRAQRRLTQ